MSKTIGFIGGGNMGSAIIGGIISNNLFPSDCIIVADPFEPGRQRLAEKYNVKTTSSNIEAASNSDILFLCVKPNMYESVIAEIRKSVKQSTLIISIAAGKSISAVEELFASSIKLIRVMPNTPALVGEGMSALCANSNVSESELAEAKAIFDSLGKSEFVKESLIDIVTGVSGSGPAYVYMFIEAMADAAVLGGMPRDIAYKFAAQTVYGSAKMVLETGKHPGELKDMVCSPAGTTIEAVAELEKLGLRSSVISAVSVCAEKSKKMSK